MDNDNTGAIRDVVTDKTGGSKSRKGDKGKEDKKEDVKAKVQVLVEFNLGNEEFNEKAKEIHEARERMIKKIQDLSPVDKKSSEGRKRKTIKLSKNDI